MSTYIFSKKNVGCNEMNLLKCLLLKRFSSSKFILQ